jgi:hypothetical protein
MAATSFLREVCYSGLVDRLAHNDGYGVVGDQKLDEAVAVDGDLVWLHLSRGHGDLREPLGGVLDPDTGPAAGD